jgi:carotenoid cleavage dioxygenase-like enzyme
MAATATQAQLGLTDLDSEITVDELPVEGELPAWLGGSLLRTGPARWNVGGRDVNHWFDGQAMLHRFSFADGRVSYANRFLRGNAFEAAERKGRIAYREFATDPCRSAFRRFASVFDPQLTDNGAVNVTRVGESYVALTETPLPVAFDPTTLETLGVEGKPPADIATAHPHHDRDTNELVGHGTKFGPKSSYVVYAMRDPGERRIVGRVRGIDRPAYMHSFGITDRYAVLHEGSLVVNPLRLAFSGRPFIENFRWEPERGSRFWVVDRTDGRTLGPWTAPPAFCFHHVNAFEQEGELVVDLLAFEDAEVVWALGLARLRAGESVPAPRLHRYRLPLDAPRAVEPELLSDVPFELPRIDYRTRNGRPYRFVYGAGPAPDGPGWLERIVKVDLDGGETHWEEPGTFPGEPVFVPRTGAEGEDDGVLLSVLLEPDRGASSLLVLDAGDLRQIARARVPHHIPFGFHGQHFGGVKPA